MFRFPNLKMGIFVFAILWAIRKSMVVLLETKQRKDTSLFLSKNANFKTSILRKIHKYSLSPSKIHVY